MTGYFKRCFKPVIYGPRQDKPVIGVYVKARLKPFSLATETSKLRHDSFQKANNKGADQSAQMPPNWEQSDMGPYCLQYKQMGVAEDKSRDWWAKS